VLTCLKWSDPKSVITGRSTGSFPESALILRRIAAYLAVLIVIAGVVVIAGRLFPIPLLKGKTLRITLGPGIALCFICCGLSILLQLSRRRILQDLGVILAVFVTFLAVATEVESLFAIDLGLDRLFMANRLAGWNLPHLGHFPPNTAMGFALAGISLCSLRRRRGKPFSEFIALVLVLLPYVSLLGYLYGTSPIYDHVMVGPILVFGLLGVALLCASPRRVLLNIILSPSAGAIASRKMILLIAVLLPALGFLQLWAEQARYVSLRSGTALSVLAAVTLFIILALRTAAVLNESDRRRLETEAALARSRQIAAAGRMAASMAHEINNPLEAVGNIVYLLKTAALPAEMRAKYLDVAEEELARVAALARRTLGFYKDETKPIEIDIPELIDSVLDTNSTKLTDKITVRKRYWGETRILARAGEVRQVIANLVANSIQALPTQGGILEISVSVTAERVIIEVRDDGHGIAGQDLDRIFEPFFTTRRELGTGLGLWVSKDLVTKNGGTIHVASSTRRHDHGTTFRLSFPRMESKNEPGYSVAKSA
jgi:signal transduction histidine kinase